MTLSKHKEATYIVVMPNLNWIDMIKILIVNKAQQCILVVFCCRHCNIIALYGTLIIDVFMFRNILWNYVTMNAHIAGFHCTTHTNSKSLVQWG
jgi:hypothetical protein